MVTGPRRRSRAAGGRPHFVKVWFSDVEQAQVQIAARRAGQAVAAWLGEAGVNVASAGRGPASSWAGTMQALMVAQAELADARRLLRLAGTNLNQVAAALNTGVMVGGGEIPAQTAVVLQRVLAAVERVEGSASAMEDATMQARAYRLRQLQ